MIILENISFYYPKQTKPAIHNLFVAFESGIVNVIIGLNGAGKTTLFDIITGLYKVKSGKILNIPDNKEILYQIQGAFISFFVRGKEYIRLIYRVSGLNFINNVDFIIDQMQLSDPREKYLLKDLWEKDIGKMSVGERRWLYVTVLSQLKRKLYIFDEPTSGVDPSSRMKIYKRLEQLTQQAESIVLISTHHLHELRFINCKIFLLHKGTLYFQGSYDEFLRRYQTDNPDIAFEHWINSNPSFGDAIQMVGS